MIKIKVLKIIFSALWLIYSITQILINCSHYSLIDFIIVIIITVFPFCIYWIFKRTRKPTSNNIEKNKNNIIQEPKVIDTDLNDLLLSDSNVTKEIVPEDNIDDVSVDSVMSNIKITSNIINDVPAETLSTMRSSYTYAQAQNDIRIFNDCSNIMMTTRNLDTYFSRYELGSRKLFTLLQASQAGIIPVNPNLTDSFFDFVNKYKKEILQKSFQKETEDIAKLKTVKAQHSHWEKYLELLMKYEDEYEFDYHDEFEKVLQIVESNLNK